MYGRVFKALKNCVTPSKLFHIIFCLENENIVHLEETCKTKNFEMVLEGKRGNITYMHCNFKLTTKDVPQGIVRGPLLFFMIFMIPL
jgi:hypothetical protein